MAKPTYVWTGIAGSNRESVGFARGTGSTGASMVLLEVLP